MYVIVISKVRENNIGDTFRTFDNIFQGKPARGRPLKSLRNSSLDLLRKLKFDDEDPFLGSKCGELKYIIDLICNEPVEFNLRVDYDLHSNRVETRPITGKFDLHET